ncbi:glycosyltransferase family 4 protein [Intrasporangium sp. YIM S08009]|uniref:glycosyltransferase family 4 protein n=1 Tax=Intrasporangium zincisolvens TaxID=3080018 RepID=UPI002B053C68|nr:glycosyltransferase family 4 protein [Intrasporangium sp. YIM S08009]
MLTGFPNYPTGRVSDGYTLRRHLLERKGGVDVHRVALYPSHDSSTFRRVANYGSFGASSMVNGLPALRGLDALWVNYSPVTVGGTQLLARYAFGVPSVVHVLDLWPDTLLAGGFSGDGAGARLSRRLLEGWCSTLYRAATSVAYIAPSVGDILRRRGVDEHRLHYVPMWADEAIFHPSDDSMRSELGIPDSAMVVLYAGALGEAQGLETLIDACGQVDDPRLVCVIAGSGISEGALRSRAGGQSNVRFIGRVEPSQMTRLMATADLAYIGLRQHSVSSATMPSKTQATLAAGVPIIASAGADVERVVDEAGAGFSVPLGDVNALAGVLRGVLAEPGTDLPSMKQAARAYYERRFSAEQGVSAIEALLTDAASTGASDRRAS